MHGMDVCWFCHEPVTEPDDGEHQTYEPAVAAMASAQSTSPGLVVPAPPVRVEEERAEPARLVTTTVDHPPARPAARPPRSSNRVRKRRVFLRSVLLGVLAAAGAVAFEVWWTRDVPPLVASMRFSTASLDAVDSDISYPDDWSVDEGKRHVTFLSDERSGERPLRGFRLTRTPVPLDEVDDQLVEQELKFRTYDVVSTEQTSLDARTAVKHLFVGDDLRYEQWWVERDRRSTIRLELWSRPADDNALDVNERVVTSLDVR